jgi:hypothetical protein
LQTRLKNSCAIFVKVRVICFFASDASKIKCARARVRPAANFSEFYSQILALASCKEADAATLLQCIMQASGKFRDQAEIAGGGGQEIVPQSDEPSQAIAATGSEPSVDRDPKDE